MLRMKRAPILLGLQRKPRKQTSPTDDWDEEEWDIQYELKRPNEIVVADDTHAYRAFGDSLFTAPQEDIIEGKQNFLYRATSANLITITFRFLFPAWVFEAQPYCHGRISNICGAKRFKTGSGNAHLDSRTASSVPSRAHARAHVCLFLLVFCKAKLRRQSLWKAGGRQTTELWAAQPGEEARCFCRRSKIKHRSCRTLDCW